MNRSLDKTKELIELHRGKNPVYEKLLNFYEKIVTEQKVIGSSLAIKDPSVNPDLKQLQIKEGFPLLEKRDFIVDIPSSISLFESICNIARNENEKMKENIQAIEEAKTINALNLKDLLKRFYDDSFIETVAGEFNIDAVILKFLIFESVQPSIAANIESIGNKIDLKNWLRGYCPVCGSPPQISLLKDEGQRFCLCSFCGFEWPSERLKCPFCENTDHNKLHYFYAEGQEARRVDLCDNCHQYIKTVDARKLDYEPDLAIEDIVTIHLDILASEKGYKRPVPGLWGM
jgi:FdhE protein